MDYYMALVGGGLAGSSLGIALAKTGARGRHASLGCCRGSGIGIYQPLIDSCALETRWWTAPDDNRDLVETTPSGLGCIYFYHPEMQQRLLDFAIAAGAELWRP